MAIVDSNHIWNYPNRPKKWIIWFYFVLTLHQLQASYQNGQQKIALITTGNLPKPLDRYKISRGSTPDADYSQKENVRVNDVLTRQRAAARSSYTQLSGHDQSSQSDQLKPEFRNTFYPPTSSSSSAHNYNVPQMSKIIVKPQNSQPLVNNLVPSIQNTHSIVKEDRSWPPEDSQEFGRVDVRVLGELIDNKALLNLRPSSNAASVRKLRRILGPDLQLDWMSIEPPPTAHGSSTKSTRSTLSAPVPQPDERLLKAVNELNFTIIRPSQDGGLVFPFELTPDQISAMKTWLLQRATCRMQFIWEDLGPLFWPRWIRRGVCENTHSCSWPPGMLCRQKGSRTLKLLRWVCKNDSGKEQASNRWRRGFQTYNESDNRNYRKRSLPEKRRSRKVRQLIRKLSLSANGVHCEWSGYEYMVNDHCACGCE